MLEVFQSDICCLVAGWRVCMKTYRRLVCRRRWQSLDSLPEALEELVVGDGILSVEFGELFFELGAADGSLSLELSEVGVGDGSLSLEFGEPVVESFARDGGLSRPLFVELSCEVSDGKRGRKTGS